MTSILRKKILVVEDDPDTSHALCIRLRVGSYEAIPAFDATSGLAKAIETHPDLVVCDVGIPGESGLDLVERIRSIPSLKGTQVLFVTANRRPEVRSRAAALEPVAFLEKPYRSQDFIQIVKDAVGPGCVQASSGDSRRNHDNGVLDPESTRLVT